MLILGLVDEPLRFLTVEFCSSAPDVMTDHPLLMDLVNKQFSPVLAALQYLASLLFADSARLSLLVGWSNCRSLEHWENVRSAQVRQLRRMVLLVSSWLQRRHCDRLEQPPWSLCLLADSRAAEAQQREVLSAWNQASPCCLRQVSPEL